MPRPLSYDSLKCVIQHLDPNIRLQVSHQCPSIKNTEKITPLKIHYLRLTPLSIIINDKQYTMGIIRHYPEGQHCPHFVEATNSEGGFKFEVDKYGFKGQDMEVTPGDLVIGADIVEDIQMLRNIENEEFQNLQLWLAQERARARRKRERQSPDDLLARILPFELRQAGSDVPYTHFLQMTTISGENQTKEIMEYNKKLGEAMKYLATKLLGRNLNVIKLEIGPKGKTLKSYFRLPESLKLTVQKLRIQRCSANVLDVFRPLISKAPLKSIQFGRHHEGRFNDPLVVNAHKLILDQYAPHVDSAQLTHPQVQFHLASSFSRFDLMVKKWCQEGRDVGHHYTYLFRSVHKELCEMNWFKTLEGRRTIQRRGLGCQDFPECIALPLANDAEVLMYVNEHRRNVIPTWILHLETHPKGYTASLE